MGRLKSRKPHFISTKIIPGVESGAYINGLRLQHNQAQTFRPEARGPGSCSGCRHRMRTKVTGVVWSNALLYEGSPVPYGNASSAAGLVTSSAVRRVSGSARSCAWWVPLSCAPVRTPTCSSVPMSLLVSALVSSTPWCHRGSPNGPRLTTEARTSRSFSPPSVNLLRSPFTQLRLLTRSSHRHCHCLLAQLRHPQHRLPICVEIPIGLHGSSRRHHCSHCCALARITPMAHRQLPKGKMPSKILGKGRGDLAHTDPILIAEIEQLEAVIEVSHHKRNNIHNIAFGRYSGRLHLGRRVWMGFWLQQIQQWTGILAIATWAGSLFALAGFDSYKSAWLGGLGQHVRYCRHCRSCSSH